MDENTRKTNGFDAFPAPKRDPFRGPLGGAKEKSFPVILFGAFLKNDCGIPSRSSWLGGASVAGGCRPEGPAKHPPPGTPAECIINNTILMDHHTILQRSWRIPVKQGTGNGIRK